MVIFDFIVWVADVFIFLYVLAEIVCLIRNNKYQKKWDKEKAMRLRIDPAISRAELCEQYVMFCKRNGCKVDF
jgi:hypothetical protein